MTTAAVFPPPDDPPADQRSAGEPVTPEEDWQPPSWEEIVRENTDRVYRLAYRLTGNRADAEDLTQEVFVRVFRSDRKSTRLNSSHVAISYAVFCLKKKINTPK